MNRNGSAFGIKLLTPEEGAFQGAKWLKMQLLCEKEELKSLFDALRPFELFLLSKMTDGKPIDETFFLTTYQEAIDDLKRGKEPRLSLLKEILASAICQNREHLRLMPIANQGFLTKVHHPLLQMQSHFFTYSQEDGVFRAMSMGLNSVFWGVQFAFPQIYQDPTTQELLESEKENPFSTLRKWAREFSIPTPFIVNGKKITSPIRLGKKCLSWIENHPHLKRENIAI